MSNSLLSRLPICSLYWGVNSTRREIYFGVAFLPESRWEEHEAGSTKALQHWDFDSDEFEWDVLERGLTQSDASSKAHAYEKHYNPPPGWKVIQTSGI